MTPAAMGQTPVPPPAAMGQSSVTPLQWVSPQSPAPLIIWRLYLNGSVPDPFCLRAAVSLQLGSSASGVLPPSASWTCLSGWARQSCREEVMPKVDTQSYTHPVPATSVSCHEQSCSVRIPGSPAQGPGLPLQQLQKKSMCKPRVLGYRNKTSRRQNQQARRSKIRSQVPLLLLSFEKSSQNLTMK